MLLFACSFTMYKTEFMEGVVENAMEDVQGLALLN